MDKPYFGIFMFGIPVLIIKSPDITKSILMKDFTYFCDRTLFTDKNIDFLSAQFLFFEKSPEWKVSRKPLTQIFSSAKIRNMLPHFLRYGKEMTNYLEKMTLENSNIEIKEVASNYMTALIAATIFGIDTNCFAEQESEFRAMGRQMFAPDMENCFRQLSYFLFHGLIKTLRFNFVKPSVTAFFKNVFTRTIDQRVSSQVQRNDLIHLLIELRKEMQKNGENGDSKVLAHAMQLFFAGFETSSSTLGFLLYELCLNNDIQNKLRAEIMKNMQEHGDFTYEAVNAMTYLHQCILETLRKYPVLPFLDRRCVRDYEIPDGSGHVIQRGTAVYIPLFGLHYDPKYFPDPEKYDPNRFDASTQQHQQRHQFCYLPFGQGPHNCIGERYGLLAVKVGLVSILTKFQVRRNKNTPVPINFSKVSFSLQSEQGLPMDFYKLNG